MARQYVVCDDTLPFVNEWVRSKGTFFFHFFSRTRPNFKKVANGQTDGETDRQSDYYNPQRANNSLDKSL